MPAVGGLEVRVGGAGPVRPLQRVVRVQMQGAPAAAVVQRARSGQPRQAAPKVTARVRLIGRVIPFGQVAVPAASSTVKSSRVNPPGTAGRSGQGLITARVPGGGQGGERVAGAVGGVAEHLHRPGDAVVVGQQRDPDGGVAVVRRRRPR